MYIGRTRDDETFKARQDAHNRELRRQSANNKEVSAQPIKYNFDIIRRVQPGESLRKAEEDEIRWHGGPKTQGGSLANKRYEMSDEKYKEAGGTLERPKR